MRRTFNICLSLSLPLSSLPPTAVPSAMVTEREKTIEGQRHTFSASLGDQWAWACQILLRLCADLQKASQPSRCNLATSRGGSMIRKGMQCARQTEQDPASSENQYSVHRELGKPVWLDQLPALRLDSLCEAEARPLDLVWAPGRLCSWTHRRSASSVR